MVVLDGELGWTKLMATSDVEDLAYPAKICIVHGQGRVHRGIERTRSERMLPILPECGRLRESLERIPSVRAAGSELAGEVE